MEKELNYSSRKAAQKVVFDTMLHHYIVDALNSDLGRGILAMREWELENAYAVGTGYLSNSFRPAPLGMMYGISADPYKSIRRFLYA